MTKYLLLLLIPSLANAATFVADQIIDRGLLASRACVSDTNKQFTSSATTATELGFVNGVTSAIQTQLDGKQATGNYITALTGDVTAAGPGSVASTVAKIQSTTVSGTTGSGNVVFSASPTMTNPVVGTQSPLDGSTKAASTAYVDAAVVSAGPAKDACNFSTTAALPTVVYANGSSGVGATLTGVALAAISVDSGSPSVGQRILVKNQVSTFQNGIYTVTQTGSGIAVFILTRATDYDQAAEALAGSSTFIISGTVNAATVWDQNSANVATMGTDAITFAQTAGPGSVTIGSLDANAANAQGLSFSGSVLSTQSADATHPGVVNNTTQTLSGAKTLSSAPTFSTMTIGSVLFAGTSGLVSQDNTNLFWNDTNNYLGLGQAVPVARLHLKADADQQSGGIKLEATGNTNAWAIWASNGNVFRLYNYSLNANALSVDGQEHFNFGVSPSGAAGVIGIKHANGVTPNGDPSLVIEQGAGPQTGNAISVFNTVPTLNFSLTHAGALSATSITDTGLSVAGIVTNTSGGLLGTNTVTGSGAVVEAASPTMTNPVVGTQAPGDNSTLAASTAFVTAAISAGGGCIAPILSKTANYTITTGDFTCGNKVVWVKCGCTAECTMTLPAASNASFELRIVNTGTAVCNVASAGSDTIFNTTETSVILPPGGTPPSSISLGADGGSLWLGF